MFFSLFFNCYFGDTNFVLGNFTPLLMTIMGRHLKTAVGLLENGANPSGKNRHNTIPLFLASASGGIEFVHLLLSRGVDVNAQTDYGAPLQVAATLHKEDVVKILLDHGADPNCFSSHLASPLASSVSTMSLQCTKILLQGGVNPNEISCGTTPLTAATKIGEIKMIECLLEAGADPDITDNIGEKAIEVAASNPNGNCQAVSTLFFCDLSYSRISRLEHRWNNDACAI